MTIPVLIFESSLSGHRAHYVSVLARELLRLGCQVVLALPENADRSPEGMEFLGDLLPHVRLQALPEPDSGVFKRLGAATKFKWLQAAVAASGCRHVYVPYADGITQAWGSQIRPSKVFPRGVVMEGLMMRGGFAYPATGWRHLATNRIAWQLQRRSGWNRIHQLDPLVFKHIADSDRKLLDRNRLIPEAIESLSSANRQFERERLGIKPGEIVIACPGLVTERKGADMLVQAVAGSDPDRDWKLVLLGSHSPKLKELVHQHRNDRRIQSVDRFASNDEFMGLFAAADLIAVCYRNHLGSASILIRAAAARKRIVAAQSGWIGWATRMFELGETCDENSVDSVRAGLARALEIEADHPAGDSTTAFLRYHTTANHVAHWTDLLCSINGLKQSNLVPFAMPKGAWSL